MSQIHTFPIVNLAFLVKISGENNICYVLGRRTVWEKTVPKVLCNEQKTLFQDQGQSIFPCGLT